MIEGSHQLSVSDLTELQFDFYISSAGCESRSTEIGRMGFRRRPIQILYLHQELAFQQAKDAAESAIKQASLVLEGGSPLNSSKQAEFLSVLGARRNARILIDISSMTRAMICEQVSLLAAAAHSGCRVFFAYLPASYYAPIKDYPKIRSIAPVSPAFSGVDFAPGDPLALVVGVGFEYGVALGVINQLEPRRTFAFWGRGSDPAFDDAVRQANFGFNFMPYEVALLEYDLLDPKSTYSRLDSVASSLIPDHRLIIVPMGPKLFCLLAASQAMLHFGKIAIFRIEHHYTPRDISASGRVILVEAHPSFFGPPGAAVDFLPAFAANRSAPDGTEAVS